MTGPWGRLRAARGGSFPALAGLYLLIFGGFGTEAPFFPLFLQSRGATATEIGAILTAGTVVRLGVGPLVGTVADTVGIRLALGCAAIAAGLVGMSYLAAAGFAALLAISMVHAAAVTSLNPLADALALSASEREGTFTYGAVRGVGSGGFVVATLLSGTTVAAFGLPSIIVVASVLTLLMPAALPFLRPSHRPRPPGPALAGLLVLLRDRPFRRVLLVAGLVIGSQSMSDTFAAIHWRAAGVPPVIVGALWAEAVGAELLVFFLVGPRLLRRFGIRRCLVLGALAGIVQWGALATTTTPALLALSQPLHGLTFALTHLTAMAVIAATVPPERAATAQAIYGTLCLGAASALVTAASGPLWSAAGASAFWTMSLLCLLAVPFAVTLDLSAEAAGRRSSDPDPTARLPRGRDLP